jgi:hypothetical protein
VLIKNDRAGKRIIRRIQSSHNTKSYASFFNLSERRKIMRQLRIPLVAPNREPKEKVPPKKEKKRDFNVSFDLDKDQDFFVDFSI